MDEVPSPAAVPTSALVPAQQSVCPRCHAPVRPEYYFCPNCGAKLTEAPLGTGIVDQLLLYAFSLVLPWIAYLAITKWQGIRYLRSPDSRARQMGLIALILIIASSIVFFWMTYIWVEQFMQSLSSQLGGIGA